MKILSLDPGIERSGFAIFDDDKLITSGLITTSKTKTKERRFQSIYDHLKAIIELYKPSRIVLEQIFFFKNQKTIVTIAQAQGVILLLASQYNLAVEFLTPLQIKQIVTGYGKADKKSVQKMLSLSLNLKKAITQDDEADAVAAGLAYCYLHKNPLLL